MLLDGRGLRQVFAWQNPFRDVAAERSEEAADRVTVLGANANFPFELQVRAFCRAAAEGRGSPLVIQFSHNALKVVGQDSRSAVSGARLAGAVLRHWVEESGARFVAVALDHYRVPAYPGAGEEDRGRAVRTARAAVDDALEACRSVLGTVSDRELQSYVDYLSSPAYAGFKREFAAVVMSLEPAWAMVDTEKLPPVLNCALTRDVIELLRGPLGLGETMVEAEYGATGSAGEAVDYRVLRGEELARFAEEVASFVAYTGADGISYPIGMGHGARRAERHEPDEERLRAVQSRIREVTGRYVPFAQHGGTGAARLVRGLVGKNNVNTHFLVAAANRMADWIQADLEGIRAGVKSACGTDLYAAVSEAVRKATVEKLREAGTLGTAPELEAFLARV